MDDELPKLPEGVRGLVADRCELVSQPFGFCIENVVERRPAHRVFVAIGHDPSPWWHPWWCPFSSLPARTGR